MQRYSPLRAAALIVSAGAVLGACAAASPPGPLTPAQMAMRDGGIPPYTKADVEFMQGMIGHHAQAVTMSSFAEPNGASSEVRVLAGRIAVAQSDEMDFMEDWLRSRRQTVPPRDGGHQHHAGMDMSAGMMPGMMPGMLSPAQLDTLSKARGPAFDWYFLTYMIHHHRGAISMVDALMSAKSAANDDNVFKFVSDVVADQSTEIARMEVLLKSRQKP